MTRPTFTIIVEDADVMAPAPTTRRLARMLKAMLRGYGFRCVSVVEVMESQKNTFDHKP